MNKIVEYEEKYLPEVISMCVDLAEYEKSLGRMDYRENFVELFASFWDWLEMIAINPNYKIFIAKKDDSPIGMIIGKIQNGLPFMENDRIGIVDAIYVKPEYQKSKCTYMLNEAIEEWFKNRGIKLISFSAYRNNNEIIEITNKRGYKKNLITFNKELSL